MKLLIVESPNKVKTISQFLSKEYVVKASVGHITKIRDSGLYNLGIDIGGTFIKYALVDKDYNIKEKWKIKIQKKKQE